MALTQEQYEQLPDFVKSEYVQSESGFIHAEAVKVSKLKTSLDGLDSKLKEYQGKDAERAAEAERAALEKLKKEGKVDEILADAERRIGETSKQYQERIERMSTQIKTEKRTAIVADLSAELATDAGSHAFKALVASRIDVDPETGKVTFLNADGSASALDLAGFKAELSKDPVFAPVIKAAINTIGGGFAQGAQQGGRTTFGAGNFAGSKTERQAAIAAKYKLPLS